MGSTSYLLPAANDSEDLLLTFNEAVARGILSSRDAVELVPRKAYGDDPWADWRNARPFRGDTEYQWAPGEEPVALRGGRWGRMRNYGPGKMPLNVRTGQIFERWARMKKATAISTTDKRLLVSTFIEMTNKKQHCSIRLYGKWSDGLHGALAGQFNVLINGRRFSLYDACGGDWGKAEARLALITELFGAHKRVVRLP